MGKYITKDIEVTNDSEYGGCDKNKVVCPVSEKEVWVFAYQHHRLKYYRNKTPEQLVGEGCRWHPDPDAKRNCPYSICGYEEEDQRYRQDT